MLLSNVCNNFFKHILQIMTLNDIFRAWLSSNDDLAKTLTANSWKSFFRLLENVQSTPFQSMDSELELTVAHNLCVSAWLRQGGESGQKIAEAVTQTVRRVICNINASKVIGQNFNDVIQALTSLKLYQNLSKTALDIVLTLLGFIILFRQSDKIILQQFLQFSSKMKICLSELNSVDLCDEDNTPKRMSLCSLSKAKSNGQADHSLLRLLIAAKYGLEPEDCDYEDIDNLHSTLIQASVHQRRGDSVHLRDCVLSLCDRAQQRRQSDAVNSLGLMMKGELLLKEKNIHAAFAVFKQIIQKEPENVRVYLSIARCFGLQGEKRQEIETFKTICKIQHFKISNRSDNYDMGNLDERIIETLFPTEPQSFERSLLTLARKCFETGEVVTSSEHYLDTLAMLEVESELDEDRVVIFQEAALSLLVNRKYEDCLTLCNQLQEVETATKRKSIDDSYSKLISNFLVGKVYYHLSELRSALKNLDASLQACHSFSTEGQNKQKRRKLNSDTDSQDAKVELGEAPQSRSDPQLLLMLRSRLYFEKSLIFKQLGDSKSQSTALKFSLRLHFSNPVFRVYSQLVGGALEGRAAETGQSQAVSHNLCLQFLTDFSNVLTL